MRATASPRQPTPREPARCPASAPASAPPTVPKLSDSAIKNLFFFMTGAPPTALKCTRTFPASAMLARAMTVENLRRAFHRFKAPVTPVTGRRAGRPTPDRMVSVCLHGEHALR